MARVAAADHGNAVLVEGECINEDANANNSIYVCEGGRDLVVGCVEEGEGECSNEDGHVEPGDPCSFIGKPDLGLDLDWGGDLLGNTDLGWDGVDGMVIADGGTLAFVVAGGVGVCVGAVVASWAGKFWEGGDGGGGEGGEDVADGMKGAADDRLGAAGLVGVL